MKKTRSIQLQPTSLLLGLAVGVLALVAMGQKPQNIRELVRVEYGPHPRDMVQIKEGAPFVVPAGRVFILTALGARGGVNGEAALRADGKDEIFAANMTYASTGSMAGVGNATSMKLVPPGFTACAGTTLEAMYGSSLFTDDARAWGYLADA